MKAIHRTHTQCIQLQDQKLLKSKHPCNYWRLESLKYDERCSYSNPLVVVHSNLQINDVRYGVIA